MRLMGLAGMAPGPNTSRAQPEHRIYPYRLRGVAVVRPNQVWSTDITTIRLARGFVYLVAIIDWYSRKVLSWRISNSMVAWRRRYTGMASRRSSTPIRARSSPPRPSPGFSSVRALRSAWTDTARALDNIFVERLWRSLKYEDIYLRGYAAMGELTLGLTQYFEFYNGERPHQSLANRTPDRVYVSAQGGGAMIVD